MDVLELEPGQPPVLLWTSDELSELIVHYPRIRRQFSEMLELVESHSICIWWPVFTRPESKRYITAMCTIMMPRVFEINLFNSLWSLLVLAQGHKLWADDALIFYGPERYLSTWNDEYFARMFHLEVQDDGTYIDPTEPEVDPNYGAA